MSAARAELRALADRLGIQASYRDTSGRERETGDPTRERLLRAMGYEAGDEASARRAREALERADAEELVEPVLVYREWQHGAPALRVNRAALQDERDYAVSLRTADGASARAEGRLDPRAAGTHLELPLPVRVTPGYYEVELEVGGASGMRRASQRLILAPRTALRVEEVLGDDRAFGLLANLYALRGAGFGHGHFGDLARLARYAGRAGADFVGVNPLHAVCNQGLDFAPYSPSSRLYRNPLYLDPEQVPELAQCEAARRLLDAPALRARRDALARAEHIVHAEVAAALLPVLRALHACFRERAAGGGERAAAYAEYCRGEGRALDDFATWEWLTLHLAGPGAPPDTAWWRWPEPLRDPHAPAVAALRREHAGEVDFRRWLQFELDRQLGEAGRAAREAGCRIGLYTDLALGAARASADTWMQQGLFALGASLGAPPDAYAPDGQNWGLPPLHPRQLRADGYRFFAKVLRAAFAHAGALRIDHVMGLLRLFWIPEGRPGSEGAYVAYRADELLGVIALESRRQRALVIGEDLGTLPPELPGLLADWGVLRSAVMRFERDDAGRFRPACDYAPGALATFATHDLPPLRGFVSGRDLVLREQAGALASGAALAAARAEREAELRALRDRLDADGLLEDPGTASGPDLARRVHAFLAGTPSRLVGVSLDDLAGETDPVNLPGVTLERYRSWSRRMGTPLSALLGAEALAAQLEPLRDRRRRPGAAE
jgi:4-alpha-glucanotransferase